MSRSIVTFAALAAMTASLAACSGAPGPAPSPVAPSDAGPPPDEAILASHPECAAEVASHVIEPWRHVAYDTEVSYETSPPSSGPHYPWWASYGVHADPVDPREYVHNEEHGAVVLLYNCSLAADCAAVQRALRDVMDVLTPDPACADGGGVASRVVISPAPDLDVPVAAATWGWTYRAQCLDAPSLRDFALAHYGRGRESICADGSGQ